MQPREGGCGASSDDADDIGNGERKWNCSALTRADRVDMGKFIKQDVREWCPSAKGPLLPTMTDSLLAPSREVLSKRYHTGELATILGPSTERDDFVRLKYTRNGCDYDTTTPHSPIL